MPFNPPSRQRSTLSSASSDNRTVQAQSRALPLSRQNTRSPFMASNHDIDDMEDESPWRADSPVDYEAGPSDYWRRDSPSPDSPVDLAPANWRESSDKPFDINRIEDGPADHYFASNGHKEQAFAPNQDDDQEYDLRMQKVLEGITESSDRPSESVISKHGYHRTYQDIMGEEGGDRNGGSIGEEEFGRLNTAYPDNISERTPSITSNNLKRMTPQLISPSPGKRASFIHPSISRLRSHMRTPSSSTHESTRQPQLAHLRTSSHFSQLSEAKSEILSINSNSSHPYQDVLPDHKTPNPPAFIFHPLRRLSASLFSSQHTPSQVGTGTPTVLDVRGMIAVGTDLGYVLVYSFRQEVLHTLGNEGSGRASGSIHLYDLSNPAKPARSTLALTLRQVLSGRREGHLQNSRILHIGFVGVRHTSIISGDEHGRAFWWSLGKVMGVESNDVVRMLGSYPDSDVEASNYPSRKSTTLFAALPLPLGDQPHSTDIYNLSALLTPAKLVIVGMKPTAKTWFRKMRDSIGGEHGGLIGCAVWQRSHLNQPILAYSWGRSVRLLRIQATNEPEIAEGKTYDTPDPVRALQWYDVDLVLLNTRTMSAIETTLLQTKLLTSQPVFSDLPTITSRIPPSTLAGSVKVHRDKLFLLHWNDRILSHVHKGDFLGAIQTAQAYYENRSYGNTINLPDDLGERKKIIANRLRDLLVASLRWAFAPERLTEDSHSGQGVDLTSLFEGLAVAAIEACLSTQELNFLFDEAYEHFSQAGIQGIFLQALAPYIFSGRIRQIPPNIFQALIILYENKGDLNEAEAIIWNVDPTSLDINQAITLCEAHGLWDAMIHVYTRAMKDFVAPLVKLIHVVRDIQQNRLDRPSLVGDSDDQDLEGWAPNAYKLYAYVESILSGLSYPSGDPLPDADATTARNDVYSFIFAGRTISWPTSQNLVLTGQGPEPPYPYLNLLLRFDTEAFLHSMDIAFEDSYLNDTSGAMNRQSIVNLMLDVMDPEYFHPGDITFLHIFVARNLPKYPQFLFIPPSTLHRILVSLAIDPDQSTREDRQLAAEYLLSAYTPHDSDAMLELFNQAGFYRILRTSYRRDGKWGKLISTLLRDPESDSEVFTSLEEIITSASMSAEVQTAVLEALPQLLTLGVRPTAILLDRDLPSCHSHAIDALAPAPHKQMAYLRCLLEPNTEETGLTMPSTHIDLPLRHLYVTLLCQHDPSHVISFLDSQNPKCFDLTQLASDCESCEVYEGQLWALDRQGKTKDTFDTVGDILRTKGVDLGEAMLSDDLGTIHNALSTIQTVSRMATRLCQEHSRSQITGEVEDMWLGVLHGIIELVHATTTMRAPSVGAAIETLRGVVQETLASLVSSSSPMLSFPRLFKRLIDASTSDPKRAKKGRTYSEFRTILTGMLDSYRAEGEMLSMTTRLVEADLYEILADLKVKREAGWSMISYDCDVCGDSLAGESVIVWANGKAVHRGCLTDGHNL